MSTRSIVVALLLYASAAIAGEPSADRTAYVGAEVFDGERFAPGVVVVEGATIVDADPATATHRIDLAGGFVVPPFCEAHNHNLGSADENAETIAHYLSEGIFYVGVLSNLPALTDPVRHTYNTPASVDVIFANGPLTASGGHPIKLREFLLEQGHYPGFTRETLPGQGYFVIDDEPGLERSWPAVLGMKPDLVKIILINSEAFSDRRDDPAFFGMKGLDPALVPSIVRRAHEAGKRVFAHIDTAHDFHVAVSSGVDVIAHLGGYNHPTRIDRDDADRAAQRGVPVVTTAVLLERRRERMDAASFEALRAAQVANLKLLREAGVRLAVGSDEPRATSSHEVSYLHGLGIFSNAELLRMWSTDCSKTLFPDRRLGALQPGFEASFLVLESDPLVDFSATRAIRLRVKEGKPIHTAASVGND